MLCKRGLCRNAVSVCLSVCVCLCVCRLRSYILWKRINISSKIFRHRVATPFQFLFLYQTAWQYSNGNPPSVGVECRWDRQKSRFWAYIWLYCVLSTLQPARCHQHDNLWHLLQVVSGGGCWWQETTTKYLWQEVSKLRQRQQKSALNCKQW